MKKEQGKDSVTPINQGTKDETLAGKGEPIPVQEEQATDAGEQPQVDSPPQPHYHSRTVQSPGPGHFICDFCQTGFPNPGDLEDHLMEVHPTEAHAAPEKK